MEQTQNGKRDLVYGKRDLVYGKRDLVYGKRDLVYGKRDLVYGKRDLVYTTNATCNDKFKHVVTQQRSCSFAERVVQSHNAV